MSIQFAILQRIRQLSNDKDGYTKKDQNTVEREFTKQGVRPEVLKEVNRIFSDMVVSGKERERLNKLFGFAPSNRAQQRLLTSFIGRDGRLMKVSRLLVGATKKMRTFLRLIKRIDQMITFDGTLSRTDRSVLASEFGNHVPRAALQHVIGIFADMVVSSTELTSLYALFDLNDVPTTPQRSASSSLNRTVAAYKNALRRQCRALLTHMIGRDGKTFKKTHRYLQRAEVRRWERYHGVPPAHKRARMLWDLIVKKPPVLNMKVPMGTASTAVESMKALWQRQRLERVREELRGKAAASAVLKGAQRARLKKPTGYVYRDVLRRMTTGGPPQGYSEVILK